MDKIYESIVKAHERNQRRDLTSAVETMREVLTSLQEAQTICINEHGLIKAKFNMRYKLLTRKIKSFKESIEWLEGMYYG